MSKCSAKAGRMPNGDRIRASGFGHYLPRRASAFRARSARAPKARKFHRPARRAGAFARKQGSLKGSDERIATFQATFLSNDDTRPCEPGC